MAESETDTSLDAGAITQIGAAAERLRTSAQWTVGAVAAVGTTVGGAISFVGLKDLDGGHFVVGAIGLFLVVITALAVIVLVAKVLAPTNTQLSELDHVPGVDRNMLFGSETEAQFAAAVDTAELELLTALHAPAPPEPDPVAPGGTPAVASPPVAAPPDATAPVADADVGRLERIAAMYGARAERIRLIAHFHELRRRWRKTLVPIMLLAMIGAGGIVAYQCATSMQRVDDENEQLAEKKAAAAAAAKAKDLPVLRRAPDLIVTFKPGALGIGVVERCAGTRRAVRVPGQSKGQIAFLLRPKGRCRGHLVRVDSTLVTFDPARVPKPR